MPYLGRLIDREGKIWLYGLINRERKTKGVPCLVDKRGKMRHSKQGIIFLIGEKRYDIHATNVRKKESLKSL